MEHPHSPKPNVAPGTLVDIIEPRKHRIYRRRARIVRPYSSSQSLCDYEVEYLDELGLFHPVRSEWMELVPQSEQDIADIQLEQILTAAEAEQVFGLAAGSVRQAILRESIPARKSAGVWLIRRVDAERRWGADSLPVRNTNIGVHDGSG